MTTQNPLHPQQLQANNPKMTKAAKTSKKEESSETRKPSSRVAKKQLATVASRYPERLNEDKAESSETTKPSSRVVKRRQLASAASRMFWSSGRQGKVTVDKLSYPKTAGQQRLWVSSHDALFLLELPVGFTLKKLEDYVKVLLNINLDSCEWGAFDMIKNVPYRANFPYRALMMRDDDDEDENEDENEDDAKAEEEEKAIAKKA